MQPDNLDNTLWSITFTRPTRPDSSRLRERVYSTYSINKDGIVCGLVPEEYHPLYLVYLTIQEFASMARGLMAIDRFEKHSRLWYTCLVIAIQFIRSEATPEQLADMLETSKKTAHLYIVKSQYPGLWY